MKMLSSLRYAKEKGFALISALMIMTLLTVLAFAMMSLSNSTTRSTNITSGMEEAKANARMALMIAIGELQKQMGPDQRISAKADIFSLDASGNAVTVANPHWTGAWDSWLAGPLADAVNPSYPSAVSHHQTIGSPLDGSMHPDYDNKDLYFRSWLLSLSPDEATDPDAPLTLTLDGVSMPTAADDAIRLVGTGSLGQAASSTDFVSARLININDSNSLSEGRYAWWVGDESQKARIMDDSYQAESALTMAQRLFRQEAPASMGNTSISGLKDIADETQLANLASLKSIELLEGVGAEKAQPRFHDITTTSYGVLADVREGGLKRDLNTILERNIDPNEVYNFTRVEEFQRPSSLKPEGQAFMLYNFDSLLQSLSPTGMANVPIQDLSAYYQLYDGRRSGWKQGIQFSSSESSPPNSHLSNGIMVSTPDFGSTRTDFDKYLREYTTLYRNVVLVKVEMVLHYITEVRTPAEIAAGLTARPPIPDTDTHKLRIGITPAMTFWNPNSVPTVMHISNNPNISALFMRETPIPMRINFKKSTSYSGAPTLQVPINLQAVTNTQQGELYTFFASGTAPLIFEPGESKVISLQFSSETNPDGGRASVDFMNRGARLPENFRDELQLVPGWNPEKFVRTSTATIRRVRQGRLDILTFKAGDYISADINGGAGGFGFTSISTARQRRNSTPAMYHHRIFNFQPRLRADAAYTNQFVYSGFPRVDGGIASTAPRTMEILPRQASQLISAMGDPTDLRDDLPQTFFYYSWKAATETHESNNISPPSGGSGRRFPARPFLHSSPMQSPFFDSLTGSAHYNNGWSWFFMPLNNMLDAPISISTRNSGYFGGGYTAESGTTHVVQQQLPLTPPISIAGLSHARLGGYSIATEAPAAGFNGVRNPHLTESYRRVSATGFAGLAPGNLQAIGNSYAHPNIPAGSAFTTVNRMFVQGVNTRTPFADHSYLANKALWDEFFFSSITPVPEGNPIFNSSPRTAKEVAEEFFFDNKLLPNRRIVPYTANMNQSELDSLFVDSNLYLDGMADKLAAHLMVKGSFNVNSTSIEAWKALFSSLKGKPVAYLDKDTSLTGGVNLKEDITTGVPVASGGAPNAESYQNSPSDPSDPEQWLGWRELTDAEITQLATAMVKQVKLRGPFLSLSEFVNRRLDPPRPTLSVKGALQAALDDADVSINAGFRGRDRTFTAAEKTYVNAVFPEAMDGAIAYGSAAYVDQADILRNMAEQLTPRGDTFVIRTYGDSIDKNGKVVARAWCEAVVQRTPEYIDSSDYSYLKQADLTADRNKTFGRKLNIIRFRWLNDSDI